MADERGDRPIHCLRILRNWRSGMRRLHSTPPAARADTFSPPVPLVPKTPRKYEMASNRKASHIPQSKCDHFSYYFNA